MSQPIGRHEVTSFEDGEVDMIEATFDGRPFERHTHDDHYSVGLIGSGVNRFRSAGRLLEAGSGQVCLCEPGEVHDGGLSGASWSYVGLLLPVDLVQRSLDDAGLPTTTSPVGRVLDSRIVAERFCALHGALRSARSSAAYRETALLDLIATMFGSVGEQADQTPSTSSPSAVTRVAVQAMRDAGGAELSLTELARLAGVTRSSLVRAVRRDTGLTPGAIMRGLRAEKAKRLILRGVPLAGAAHEAGFADQSHMTRAVRARFGLTPGQLGPA